MATEKNPFDSDDSASESGPTGAPMQELQPMQWVETDDGGGGGGGAYGGDDAMWKEHTEPAVSSGGHANTVPARGSPVAGGASDDPQETKRLAQREAELARREAEIIRRENALKNKETTQTTYNWPSRRYWAMTYHSIKTEIPPDHRGTCRIFYLLWIANATLLVYNFFILLIVYLSGAFEDGEGSGSPTLTVLFSFAYALLGIIFSWRWWYRDFYFALRDSKTRKWVSFFVTFVLHIGWNLFVFLGIPRTATVGLIVMLDVISKGGGGWTIVFLVEVLLSGIIMVVSFYLLKVAHRIYVDEGHSARARREATREVGKVAVDAAAAGRV